MKEFLVHIRPLSEFPLVHSDRLFGAICVAMKDLYGEEKLDNMLEDFKRDPPFLLSSTFPYIKQDDNEIYFLPKPIEDIEMVESYKNYVDNYKRMKNVKYISNDLFNQWINGKIDDKYILKNLDNYDVKSGLLFPKDKKLKFNIDPWDIPRNRINRINNSSESLFYFESNSYKNVNIFFIVRIYNHEYEELLNRSIKFLRDNRGFGKGISIGKGRFEIGGDIFFENKILNIPENHERFTSLSRYIPSIDEINRLRTINKVFYDIGTKRGMVSGDKPKKQIHFFSEGSTFPIFGNKSIYGRILYVYDKSVEYGFAFNVGMKK